MMRALPLLAAALCLPILGKPTAAAPSPLSRTIASDPSLEVEDVSFVAQDKVKLSASFFAPRKKGRAHAVLLVHDAGGDRKQLEELGASLQRAGFAVLSLDLRAHGQSVYPEHDWTALDEAGRARTWVLTLRDLAAAAEYLRSREDVHSSSLTLIGYRSGGGAAIRYASTDLNVRAVVALDPVQDELGFNLVKDLVALEELQTMIVSPKDGRVDVDRLVKAGHTATGGNDAWIHPCVLKSDSTGFLQDKRLGREVSDWVRETVDPSKK